MHAISTRDLAGMPDIPAFRRLTQSLAVLDAILSREWEYRYYSFDSRWGPGELMASMRNGQGDHWFALMTDDGVVLHGLHHEAPIDVRSFAAQYYGVEIPLDAVADVYRHMPLTTELVARLNPAVLLADLASDLEEIGYPDARP